MKRLKKVTERMLILLLTLCMAMTPVTVSADTKRVSKISNGSGISAGYYYLIPMCAPNRVLSIYGGRTTSGTKAVTGAYAFAKQRVFYISGSTGGTYTLKNYKSGKVLEAKNNTMKNGGAVVQASYSSATRQRWYIMNRGGYYTIQSSISKKVLGVHSGSTKIAATVNIQTYTNASKQRWKLVKYTPKKTTPTPKRLVYSSTVNGKKTLKSYLQNAMVPVGRTLYIWGGGWGSDASIIGYQSNWNKFFLEYGKSGYDYTKYRFKYGYGLDCSGFAAWTLYNTLYTKSKQASVVYQSSTVASNYAAKGWATLARNGSDRTFKPGDVVSRSGHVWISLGQYSDGSVIFVHSTPTGVQISGTSGTAATKAAYYMKKYFPEWPYSTKTMSSSYLTYVGKARWNIGTTGAIMKDPDGIQKMSADKVMKLLFGS
ncbi:MAG: RICIN domain-containing protein [Lachnospiraceae bacterium]|nr:RICIN domain-containing protein [Lachnospiraceae bacterium]